MKLNQNPAALFDFRSLIEEYTDDLYYFCLSRGLVPDRAEEVVQATWMNFIEKPNQFEGRSQIKTYLIGICHFKILELYKQDKRSLALEDEHFGEKSGEALDFDKQFRFDGGWLQSPIDPESQAFKFQLNLFLKKCLELLPHIYKTIIYLKDLMEEDSHAVAQSLQISDTNFRVSLFRARNNLRSCIESKMSGGRKPHDV